MVCRQCDQIRHNSATWDILKNFNEILKKLFSYFEHTLVKFVQLRTIFIQVNSKFFG